MTITSILRLGTLTLLGAAGFVLVGAALTDAGPAAAQTRKPVPQPFPQPIGASYKQTVLAAHPAAYWRLGEPKGSATAVDATGNKHNGTYFHKPHLGQHGAIAFDKDTAMGLDGPKSRAYVEIKDDPVFSVATSHKGLSVEVWLRPDVFDFAGENKDPKNAYIHWLGKGEAGQYEWGFRFYNQHAQRHKRISAYIWNPNGGEGAGAYFEDNLVAKQWLHIVATFDDPKKPNARVQIYKNGEPSKHNSSPGTLYKSYNIQPVTGKAPVRLGTRDLRQFLTGGLDEVAIYQRVLTPAEIRRHWLIGSGSLRPQ